MGPRSLAVVAVIALAASADWAGQGTPPASPVPVAPAASPVAPARSPSPAPDPCRAPEYRQFDFWLGDWDVFDPGGRLVGTNLVTREHDGCVVQEHWEARGPRKQTGSSFNTYHAAAGMWHQTWVDSTGGFLLLDGGLVGDSMVLGGEMLGRRGRVRHRITFTPMPEGRVRQFWESSPDGGKTWSVAFDGTYVRREKR